MPVIVDYPQKNNPNNHSYVESFRCRKNMGQQNSHHYGKNYQCSQCSGPGKKQQYSTDNFSQTNQRKKPGNLKSSGVGMY